MIAQFDVIMAIAQHMHTTKAFSRAVMRAIGLSLQPVAVRPCALR